MVSTPVDGATCSIVAIRVLPVLSSVHVCPVVLDCGGFNMVLHKVFHKKQPLAHGHVKQDDDVLVQVVSSWIQALLLAKANKKLKRSSRNRSVLAPADLAAPTLAAQPQQVRSILVHQPPAAMYPAFQAQEAHLLELLV